MVRRQIPISALGARQRAIVNVLRARGPIAENLLPNQLAQDMPAFKGLPAASVNYTLQLLYEAGWAEPTHRGWITRKDTK